MIALHLDSKSDRGEVLINSKMEQTKWAAMSRTSRYGLRRLSIIECSSSSVCVLDESMSFDIVIALTRWQAMRDA